MDMKEKIEDISRLTTRFIKAKDLEEKWHVMDMAYAKGFSSVGKYMLESIRFTVKHIQPERAAWWKLKMDEFNHSDFSGASEGER